MSRPNPLLDIRNRWKRAQKNDAGADYCSLATVDGRGNPCVRTVFIKNIDVRGVAFVTQAMGPKARQMETHPTVEACWNWITQKMQVRLRGRVVPLPQDELEALWAHRNRDAQMLYHVGIAQSRRIPSYHYLLHKMQVARKQWRTTRVIPYSANYVGFIIRPQWIEILHHSAARLNKREKFVRSGTHWRKEILAP